MGGGPRQKGRMGPGVAELLDGESFLQASHFVQPRVLSDQLLPGGVGSLVGVARSAQSQDLQVLADLFVAQVKLLACPCYNFLDWLVVQTVVVGKVIFYSQSALPFEAPTGLNWLKELDKVLFTVAWEPWRVFASLGRLFRRSLRFAGTEDTCIQTDLGPQTTAESNFGCHFWGFPHRQHGSSSYKPHTGPIRFLQCCKWSGGRCGSTHLCRSPSHKPK